MMPGQAADYYLSQSPNQEPISRHVQPRRLLKPWTTQINAGRRLIPHSSLLPREPVILPERTILVKRRSFWEGGKDFVTLRRTTCWRPCICNGDREVGFSIHHHLKLAKGATNDKSLIASNVVHTNQFVKIAFSCGTNNLTLQTGHETNHTHDIIIRDTRSRKALSENA